MESWERKGRIICRQRRRRRERWGWYFVRGREGRVLPGTGVIGGICDIFFFSFFFFLLFCNISLVYFSLHPQGQHPTVPQVCKAPGSGREKKLLALQDLQVGRNLPCGVHTRAVSLSPTQSHRQTPTPQPPPFVPTRLMRELSG